MPFVGRARGRVNGLIADKRQRESLIGVITNFGAYGLALVTGPILARTLEASGRGDLAAVLVPTQLFGWLVSFGVPAASGYYAKSVPHREIHAASWLFTLVGGGLAVAALWPFVPYYLEGHDPVTVPWFRIALLTALLLIPAGVGLEIMRSKRAGPLFNLLYAMPFAINAAALVVLALTDQITLGRALACNAGSYVVQAVTVVIVCRVRLSLPRNLTTLRLQLRYGYRVAFGAVAGLVIQRLDQLLMVRLVSSASLGIYAVGVTAAGLSTAVSAGVSRAIFSHMRHAEGEVIAKHTREAARWVFLASSAVALLLAATGPYLVPLLFGPSFRAAIVPMWLLLPGQVASDVGQIYGTRLMAEGRPGQHSLALAAGAVVSAVAIVPAVNAMGIAGAALVTTLSQFVYLAYVQGVIAWSGTRAQRARRWRQEAAAEKGRDAA